MLPSCIQFLFFDTNRSLKWSSVNQLQTSQHVHQSSEYKSHFPENQHFLVPVLTQLLLPVSSDLLPLWLFKNCNSWPLTHTSFTLCLHQLSSDLLSQGSTSLSPFLCCLTLCCGCPLFRWMWSIPSRRARRRCPVPCAGSPLSSASTTTPPLPKLSLAPPT